MEEVHDLHPLLPEKHQKRDDLLISLPMAKIILMLRDIGTIILSILSGFSIMFCICSYGWLSDFEFFNYYSDLAPNYSIAFCYLLTVCCIIVFTYLLFGIIIDANNIPKVMLIISGILSLITLILSLMMVKTSEIICAMNRRRPQWWLKPNNDGVPESWEKKVFLPYKIEDIFRCCLLCIETFLFIFGAQFISSDLAIAFSVNTK